MIILSFLIHLSVRWAAIIAIVSLIGHNILDYYFDFNFRLFLGYGDSVVWAWQNSNVGYSLLGLFAMTKNPPSLQYLSFGIGIACLLLVLFDRYQPKIGDYLLVYGRTPLFLYIIHVPILNAISWVWHTIAFGGRVNGSSTMIMSLVYVYLIWLALLPPLYFLCKWYQPKKLKYI